MSYTKGIIHNHFVFKNSANGIVDSMWAGVANGTRYRYIGDEPLKNAGSAGAGNAGAASAQAGTTAAAKTRSRPNSEYVLYAQGEPVAMSADGDTSYFGTDILGSVRSVTDRNGQVKASYEYDAFGTPYLSNIDSGMSFGYTGKIFDSDTGLYDYGFRDYAPNSARFTTVDPVRDGNNWFSYVVNDPVNYIDPNGLYVQNNTNQWILIKTEEKGFVSLAPGAKYDGKNVTNSPNNNNEPIDFGKIDGIILSDGTIFKVSDSGEKNPTPWDISVTVKQDKNGEFSFHYSNPISWGLDKAANNKKNNGEEPSGIYHIGDGSKAGNWLQEVPSQEALKNSTLPDVNRFYEKNDVENLNSNYSDKNDSTPNSLTQNSKNSNTLKTFVENLKNTFVSGIKQLFQQKGCTK